MIRDRLRKIYLTFDIDWARDEVIAFLLDLLEEVDVPATIFVTHDTPLLERMRHNPNIELGGHPNFIPLVEEDYDVKDFLTWARERILYYKELVPEATSIRVHGLTQNSRLLDLFAELGY